MILKAEIQATPGKNFEFLFFHTYIKNLPVGSPGHLSLIRLENQGIVFYEKG